MVQLTLKVPEQVAEQLARRAAKENKSVEQVAVERLSTALAFDEARKQYEPLSDEELLRLAEKAGAAGPLSEVIIAERKQGY
jgi:plasmid stability protein